jgi:uncharacterized protein (DUF433 family)
MTMSVHEALESWARGKLPLERAYARTGAESVAELLTFCDSCDVPRPELVSTAQIMDAFEAGRIDEAGTIALLGLEGREDLQKTMRSNGRRMPSEGYDAAAIHVLKDMPPPRRRPAGHVEDDPVIVRKPGLMGGAACFRGTRVNVETLFINLVDDSLDDIVGESFPTLDRADCITALEQGEVLVAEAGLLTPKEASLMFGLLASKWHISLEGFLAEYPEFGRDRCVAALWYAGAALAASAREVAHDNPQGLATFDPMTHQSYRAVARLIAGRHAQGDVAAALAVLNRAPDVPPDPSDEMPEEDLATRSRARGLADGGRLALPVTALTDAEMSLILASEPSVFRQEWWWIVREGDIEIARVTFDDFHCQLQEPPQPWWAEVVGLERSFWPRDLRLVVQVVPVIEQMNRDG